MDTLDEDCHELDCEIKQITADMKKAVDKRDFPVAGRLQAQVQEKKNELKEKSALLLEKRQKYVEDVIVTDMKSGWQLPEGNESLDLSDMFKKPNGHISVGKAINDSKTGVTVTPRTFYVISSTTNTYHELVVKYKDLESDEKGPVNVRQLENEILEIEKKMREAAETRDFANAGKYQKDLEEKQKELDDLKRKVQSELVGAVMPQKNVPNLRQLKNKIEDLENLMNEAAEKFDYETAGQLQIQIEETKKELAEAEQKLGGAPQETELNSRALQGKIDRLKAEIEEKSREMKSAADARNFLAAGNLQKEINSLKKEIEKTETALANSGGGGATDNSQLIAQLEEECKEIEVRMKEYAQKRDFPAAGKAQAELEEKRAQLEELQQPLTYNIRQMEDEINDLRKQMKEAASRRAFPEAGRIQETLNQKEDALAKAKKEMGLDL